MLVLNPFYKCTCFPKKVAQLGLDYSCVLSSQVIPSELNFNFCERTLDLKQNHNASVTGKRGFTENRPKKPALNTL